MHDLTTELRRMADEAQQVRPRGVAEILQNGDRLRRRRLAVRSAGLSAAAVAVIAVALTAVQTGTPQARQPGTGKASAREAPAQKVQLAAWTVARQADGNVSLTIRQLADLPGLQRALSADDVPASALTLGQANPCHVYGTAGLQNVLVGGPSTATTTGSDATVLVIHPSGLPSGDGLQFIASPGFGQPGVRSSALSVHLVQASPACTGR
jgi:hypothetical protein